MKDMTGRFLAWMSAASLAGSLGGSLLLLHTSNFRNWFHGCSASGLRNVCGSAINALAVAIFAAKGLVDYKRGVPMMLAGMAGGYWGAHGVKRLDAKKARMGILIYAWALTAWFFVRMAMGADPSASATMI